jgi:hypothetical protein
MSDYSKSISLPSIKKGDRWFGINNIGPVTINGNPPSNDLVRVRANFVKSMKTYKLDSDLTTNPDAPIIIDDAALWSISIPPVEYGFCPCAGKWTFDMEFIGEGQGALTLLKGDIMVYSDITI